MNSKIEFKYQRYEALAKVSKVFASARRLEIVDALIQQPASVEGIAQHIHQSVANTSQHLQVLKRAKVVQTQREGTTIIYRLTDGMMPLFVALRQFAEQTSPELQILKQETHTVPLIDFATVQQKLQNPRTLLLDVRSEEEFACNHMKGAVNIPSKQIPARLEELNSAQEIIVTCRGPYCVSSIEITQYLLKNHFRVFRYDDGIGEWQAQGGMLIQQSS